MSDSEDSDSSGSDSESDFEDIFGESSDEEGFEGFVYEIPDNIDWRNDPDGAVFRSFYEDKPHTAFNRRDCGPTINHMPDEGRPIDLFKLYISDEFLQKVVGWTNRWFTVKTGKDPDKPLTDVKELKAFLALLLAMNKDVNLPKYENYFRQDERMWLFLVPGFNHVFTLKRFQFLNRYVFFADPDSLQVDRLDKLAKIRPLVEELQLTFKRNFNCGKKICIDECMIPYKGKLSFKQRILSKPVRWGIKLYELCDSETAYLSKFEVYLGKSREEQEVSDIGNSGAVVARLTEDLHGKGHYLYIDNFYNSVSLCIYLQARNIYVCGTVRSNRKGFPPALKDLKASTMGPRGSFQLRSYHGIVAFTWKDNKLVNFLSSIHSPDQVTTIQRNQRQRGGGYEIVDVQAHSMIEDYNANMGGVDSNDQLTTVMKNRRQMRWYMRLVIKFLEAVAFNSYIIEGFFIDHTPPGKRKRCFATFREELILQLVGNWRMQRLRPGRKRQANHFRLDNVGDHLPVKGIGCDHTCQVCTEKRRRYIASHPDVPKREVPYKLTKTTFMCDNCNVYLCISREQNCFKAWHTKVEYWKD